jgi:hypothetical protein
MSCGVTAASVPPSSASRLPSAIPATFADALMLLNYNKRVVDDCNLAPCGGSTIGAQKKNFAWGFTVGAGVEPTTGVPKLQVTSYAVASTTIFRPPAAWR